MKCISVLMATYNGELYIKDQLSSILNQLSQFDELIISDDGSSDNTIEIVETFLKINSNITLYKNNFNNVTQNFEFAISKSKNDIIVFSDQDDIWKENKVSKIRSVFNDKKVNVYLHNAIILSNNTVINKPLIKKFSYGLFNNLIKSCYWGSCMAVRNNFIKKHLPFPKIVPSHDQWIGLLGEKTKSSFKEEIFLGFHRIHNMNLSKKQSFFKRILFRIKLIRSLLIDFFKTL